MTTPSKVPTHPVCSDVDAVTPWFLLLSSKISTVQRLSHFQQVALVLRLRLKTAQDITKFFCSLLTLICSKWHLRPRSRRRLDLAGEDLSSFRLLRLM
jgi:hypothetical protein